MFAEHQPRAVVRGEDHERLAVELLLPQGLENLAYAPVEFFDHVAVQAARALAGEVLRGEQGDVRHRVGEVEEEWLFPIRLDELHRILGVPLGERVLVGRAFDDPVVAHERHVPVLDLRLEESGAALGPAVRHAVHVVHVRQAEERVEPVLHWEVFGEVAQVPFADAGGGIPAQLEDVGECDLRGRQSAGGVREEDPAGIRAHAGADRQPAGEKGRPARGADGRGRVEAGELEPLGGHPVQVRGANGRVAITAEVSIPQIVGEDDDEVRLLGRGGRGREKDGPEAGGSGHGGSGYFCSVRTTERTSITPLPEISVARRVSVPRPFFSLTTPKGSGLKSLTYDSPARGTRSWAAPTSGGSWAAVVLRVHVEPFKVSAMVDPTASFGQVW